MQAAGTGWGQTNSPLWADQKLERPLARRNRRLVEIIIERRRELGVDGSQHFGVGQQLEGSRHERPRRLDHALVRHARGAVTLSGRPYNVVGVMPRGISFFAPDTELWIPMQFDEDDREPRGRSILVLGRLRVGVTMQQAQADMQRVSTGLVERWPDFNTGWSVNVVPLQEQVVGEIRPALLVLLGAVAFVLLIACANVANCCSLVARAASASSP